MKLLQWSGITLDVLRAPGPPRHGAARDRDHQPLPGADEVERGSNATAGTAAQATLGTYLAGPSLKTSPLQARLDAQVREEAKLAGCPFLVLTTIKHEQKQQGTGVLSRVAAGVVQQGASEVLLGSGSTEGRIVGSAARGAAAQAALDYASTLRNKDEITLGFRGACIQRMFVRVRHDTASPGTRFPSCTVPNE